MAGLTVAQKDLRDWWSRDFQSADRTADKMVDLTVVLLVAQTAVLMVDLRVPLRAE